MRYIASVCKQCGKEFTCKNSNPKYKPQFCNVKCYHKSRIKDLIGQRFGKLVVIELEKTLNKNSMWLCKCDCGKHKIAKRNDLIRGATKSCGCLKKEINNLSLNKISTKHSLSKEKLYYVWKTMRQRCNNSKQHDYKWYGAKGIDICRDWENPVTFISWAKSNGYQEGLTLDRIDGNKGYNPENCRWISIKKQQQNKSNVKIVEFNNKKLTLHEWENITGIPKQRLYERIFVRKWDISRALSTPILGVGKYIIVIKTIKIICPKMLIGNSKVKFHQ